MGGVDRNVAAVLEIDDHLVDPLAGGTDQCRHIGLGQTQRDMDVVGGVGTSILLGKGDELAGHSTADIERRERWICSLARRRRRLNSVTRL